MTNELKNYAENILSSYTELNISWNDNYSEVTIHKTETNGFDIIVCIDELNLYIFTDCGYHDNWQLSEFKNTYQALESVFGVVRDPLCQDSCRLNKFTKRGELGAHNATLFTRTKSGSIEEITAPRKSSGRRDIKRRRHQ